MGKYKLHVLKLLYIMRMDTGPTSENLQQSFCSVETNVSPNHFRTINSIYQLHSIINKLSIEKQKSNITLSNALKNHNTQITKLNAQIMHLKQFNKKTIKQVQFHIKQTDKYKNQCDLVRKQRDNLQNILDSVPKIENRMSVNLLISEYQKQHRILQHKNIQIFDANRQIKQLQNQILQNKVEINSLRNNLEQHIQISEIRLEQLRNLHKIEMNRIKTEYKFQQQKTHESLLKSAKQKQQIERQNHQLNSKLEQMKKSMNEQYKLYIQNQLLELNNISKPGVKEQKHEELKRKFNDLIQEKNQNLIQFNLKQIEISKLQIELENHKSQISILEDRLNQKIMQQHKTKQFLQLNTIQVVKIQTTNHLATLQQISISHSNQKKQLQSEIEMHKRKNKLLEQKIEQINQSKQLIQRRINNQQFTIQRLQNSNQVLTQKCNQFEKTNKMLKFTNDNLNYQYQQLKLEMRRNQSKINQGNDPTKIPIQKYKILMETTRVLDIQKSQLLRQNTQLKLDLQKSQNQTINAIKCKNSIQYQLRDKIRIIQSLQVKNQDSVENVVKLKNKIDKIGAQHKQQIRQLQSKMKILNECVYKLKQQRIIQQQLTNKVLPVVAKDLYICRKVLQITIKSAQPYTPKITDTIQVKPLNKLRKMMIPQKKKQNSFSSHIQSSKQEDKNPNIQLNMASLQQIKYKQRIHSDRRRIDRVQEASSKTITESEDQKLNKIIKQLKKQNRQLSKGHFNK